jgi:hypothetical protein
VTGAAKFQNLDLLWKQEGHVKVSQNPEKGEGKPGPSKLCRRKRKLLKLNAKRKQRQLAVAIANNPGKSTATSSTNFANTATATANNTTSCRPAKASTPSSDKAPPKVKGVTQGNQGLTNRRGDQEPAKVKGQRRRRNQESQEGETR